MTDQEALQTIAAIAEWVEDEMPQDGATCGDAIRRIHELTSVADCNAMSDDDATQLFADVLATLKFAVS